MKKYYKVYAIDEKGAKQLVPASMLEIELDETRQVQINLRAYGDDLLHIATTAYFRKGDALASEGGDYAMLGLFPGAGNEVAIAVYPSRRGPEASE